LCRIQGKVIAMPGLTALLPGDVLISATQLDEAQKFPTGQGRIMHLDADLTLKGTWDSGRYGLVSGLGLGKDGTVFIMDAQARGVDRIGRDGTVLEPIADVPPKGYGSMVALPDGGWLFGEHLCGAQPPFQGEGKVDRFNAAGHLVQSYDTQVNGGVGGFLGVTHIALAADGKRLFHVSETGPHVYAHDLTCNQPLGPIYSRADPPPMVFGVAALPDGGLLVACGGDIRRLDAAGAQTRSYSVPEGRGWSVVVLRPDGKSFWAADFFAARLVQINLESGDISMNKQFVGIEKALAGVVEIPA
jgi:hypothetical protein